LKPIGEIAVRRESFTPFFRTPFAEIILLSDDTRHRIVIVGILELLMKIIIF